MAYCHARDRAVVLPLLLFVAPAKALVGGCSRIAVRHGFYLDAVERAVVRIAVKSATRNTATDRLTAHA